MSGTPLGEYQPQINQSRSKIRRPEAEKLSVGNVTAFNLVWGTNYQGPKGIDEYGNDYCLARPRWCQTCRCYDCGH